MGRYRLYAALFISVMWAVSYVASVAERDFTGFEAVTPVMLIVAGWLFVADLRNHNGH